MTTAILLAVAILVSFLAPTAAAQKYPNKPIRLVVPFSPGGGTDIMSRVLAIPVSKSLGQTVVVDNRPGAGGAIGAELAAMAAPDGYTIVMISSSYTASAAVRKLPYDPVDGIQPIVLIGTTGLVMVVHPSVPVKSVKELIAHAQANPGKLNYASVGTGSVTHLAHELFKLETNTSLVHVPYKGGGPALGGVVRGEVQMTAISMVPTIPHLRAGRLRAIGITYPKRSSVLPDVPAIAETVPGFQVVHWYGMWGPKGMPKRIASLWHKEVAKVLLSDQMKTRLRNEGLEPGGGPEHLYERIKGDVARWKRVVKDAKIEIMG